MRGTRQEGPFQLSTRDRTERLRQLDADLLMTLDALLRDQNVTKAARRLGITQSAMSGRLTRLRAVFDDRLFVTTSGGRGVVATPRALAMREAVAAALAALESLVASQVSFDARSSERTFTVAMHDNPAAILAPTLIARCQVLAPRVRIAIVLPRIHEIAAALEKGDVDVLIGSPVNAHADWKSRVIVKEQFSTAQRKQHPRGRAPMDLDTYCALSHLIVSSEGGGFSGAVDELLASQGRKRLVAASVQSYALAPLIVAASDLVCTLPRRLFSRFSATLDLFDPPLDLVDYELAAFWHPRRQDDPAHIWLRDRIAEASRAAVSS